MQGTQCCLSEGEISLRSSESRMLFNRFAIRGAPLDGCVQAIRLTGPGGGLLEGVLRPKMRKCFLQYQGHCCSCVQLHGYFLAPRFALLLPAPSVENIFQLLWSPDSKNILHTQGSPFVLKRHSTVFNAELGTLKGYEAKLQVDPTATPRFYEARSVPYSLKDMIEKELDRLENEGIIKPIQFADWAAPIVPVLKSDGKSVRICGDFKVTVNQAAKVNKYPVPKIQDLFAQVGGGKRFTKLYLSQAYQQVKLDEASKAYTVINTHRGLFRYNRLLFGVASAPSCCQRMMEIEGHPGHCRVY